MKWHVVVRYIGVVLLVVATFMFLSAVLSFIEKDEAFVPLLFAGIITGVAGIFPMIFTPKENELNTREGHIIVALAWLFGCLFGMLPYVLWGGEFTVTNAWFESVSGFTTTGATILNDIEVLPKGLLFWRSSTHWIGGVGVVVFTLIVLPSVGSAKMRLSRAESFRLAQHKDAKHTSQQIVRIVLKVYVWLTLLSVVALLVAGMTLFDAVNHAFSAVATGGFSTKNASIMHYDSVAIEVVLIVIMLLSSINYGLLYVAIIKRVGSLFSSPIVRYYLGSVLVGVAVVALSLRFQGNVESLPSAVRQASFQMVALVSTTGFAGCDNVMWPPLAIMVSLVLMLQCGCAGSTSGGIKADRIVIFHKALVARIRKNLHPNAVVPIKLKGVVMDDDAVSSTTLFIGVYIAIVLFSAILLLASGVGLTESVTGAISCMGNVGPGYGAIASLGNFGDFGAFSKVICTLTMLIGRLEIFGFIVIFYFRYWR
ncbi:MAG: TrkH family potassium uptake protein [Prevotellaceae bacterium]|jgi:trk system potassium uptake protein TrkH|nr:TrkH family potassium uptake protein [Prevotellaceae bacterium]